MVVSSRIHVIERMFELKGLCIAQITGSKFLYQVYLDDCLNLFSPRE